MGKRGPAPTPTAILKLRNSTLLSRREGEPRAEKGRPSRPDWLDAKARYAWDQLIPMLERMGVLATIDGKALARYCQLWTHWRECEEVLREKGQTFEVFDENQQLVNVKTRPEANLMLRLSVLLLRLEQEFGLTPAARSRIRLEGEKDAEPKDPKADFKARLFGAG